MNKKDKNNIDKKVPSASQEEILKVATRIIKKHINAFKELAK